MAKPDSAVLARHDIVVRDLSDLGSAAAPAPEVADAGSVEARAFVTDAYDDQRLLRADGPAVGSTRSITDLLESDAHGEDYALAVAPTIAAKDRFAAWSQRYLTGLVAIDAVVGATAATVPTLASNTLGGAPFVALLGLVGLLVWPATVAFARGYQRGGVGVGTNELRAGMRAAAILVIAGAFPAGLLQQQALLKLVVVAAPLAMVLSLVGRFAARKVLHAKQAQGRSVRHIVIVGNTASARELSERLGRETHCGMNVMGICLPQAEVGRALESGLPVLGSLADVAGIVARTGADAVAVTSDDATRNGFLRKLSWSLEGMGVEMLVDPGLVEVAGPRMHIRPLVGFPLLHVEEPHFAGAKRVVKRAVDLVLTGGGLLMISPIMLGIALAVKLQDGGPVFFRQSRIGRSGEPFMMLKFRSMVIDAEARKAALMERNEGHGGLFKLSHDPRITRIGQFLRDYSLDELPQLFNVLNGTMSLVGPRPHLQHELDQMPSEASRRALVTPGLTGLWQVSGRSDLAGDEGVRLDLRYVENWSLTLDLLILWKTASAVLAKRGAR